MAKSRNPLANRKDGPPVVRVAKGRKSPAMASRNRAGSKGGRPPKGAEITLAEYKAALIATGANYNATAEMLGCSASAVYSKVKNYPELQEIRADRMHRRIETAIGVLEWALSEANKDMGLKFNAAKYELDRQSDEFKKSVDVAATVGIQRLPDMRVEFVDPEEAE